MSLFKLFILYSFSMSWNLTILICRVRYARVQNKCVGVRLCTSTNYARAIFHIAAYDTTLRLKMAELSTPHLQRSTIFARICTEREEFQGKRRIYFFVNSHLQCYRFADETCYSREKKTRTYIYAHVHLYARVQHVRRIPPVLIANTRATFKKGLELLILPSLAYYYLNSCM